MSRTTAQRADADIPGVFKAKIKRAEEANMNMAVGQGQERRVKGDGGGGSERRYYTATGYQSQERRARTQT